MVNYHMYYGVDINEGAHGFVIMSNDNTLMWSFGYRPNITPAELKDTPEAIEGMKKFFEDMDEFTKILAAVHVEPEKGIEGVPNFIDYIQLPDFELDE